MMIILKSIVELSYPGPQSANDGCIDRLAVLSYTASFDLPDSALASVQIS